VLLAQGQAALVALFPSRPACAPASGTDLCFSVLVPPVAHTCACATGAGRPEALVERLSQGDTGAGGIIVEEIAGSLEVAPVGLGLRVITGMRKRRASFGP
jgi:hypothetical protein